MSREQLLKALPTLERKGLRGGSIYYDGQFDDARLALCLAQTAADHGAVVVNYMKVTSLIKRKAKCCGVRATDLESGTQHQLFASVVINATGVFSDQILRMDRVHPPQLIAPSQGIHIVLDKSFQPGKMAILIPHTSDNRVLFMVPWHGRVLIGTTDTPRKIPHLEPKPLKEEVDFLLDHTAKYLSKIPSREDILSIFAGLRPLAKGGIGKKSSSLSRDHSIFVTQSGLVTIVGGKWTTYRKMAEDVINRAALVGGLPERSCNTETLPLFGYEKGLNPLEHFSTYGSYRKQVLALAKGRMAAPLHPRLPYIRAEVIWSVRKEMARTVEDVLSRRTRSLLLDSKAAIEIAPKVASLMAKELQRNPSWEKKQCAEFLEIAKHYTA